jgi:hypothetical protein
LDIIDTYGDDLLDLISPEDLMASLEATITILRVLTIFSLYQDAVEDGKVPVPIEQRYTDFCVVMKDMLCETWRLFYLVFRRVLGVVSTTLVADESNENRKKVSRCCELLSLLHEELGIHRWCSCGNRNSSQSQLIVGGLLELMMDQFLKYNTGDYDHEVIQCLFCLYAISVSVFCL